MENEKKRKRRKKQANMNLREVLDKWMTQEKIHHFEGRRGVENLARIARALGYKDSMYFGQFQGGSLGDLIEFFNDNPGAIEAVIKWIGKTDIPEWRDKLSEILPEDKEEEEENGYPPAANSLIKPDAEK